MKHSLRSALAVVTGVTALAGVAAIPAIVSAWGDTDGGRQTYSLQQVNEGALGDKITFNSISIKDTDYDWYKETTGNDLPAGTITEEVNYVGARVDDGKNNGAANVWNGNEIEVHNGETYLIRLYVHNNNPGGYDAVAENTKVSFNIPSDSDTTIRVNGYIESSNASPAEYVDYVDFKSDQAFHLEYVYGSALLENNGIGANGGVKLSDDIVKSKSGGVLIGYDALNGKVPGCYEYANYITIKVKAVFDSEFTIDKQVRLKDGEDKTWKDSLNVKVGDKVEYQLTYQNTSDTTQENVVISDVLPANVKYVAGSTVLYNVNHPSGLVLDTDAIVEDNGINIGAYTAGSNAFIRFTAEVVDNDLECGSNTLVNWGQASVGETMLQDHAEVVLTKVCEEPEPTPEEPEEDLPTELPSTGPEAVAGSALALGSLGTAAGYYVVSRRRLR